MSKSITLLYAVFFLLVTNTHQANASEKFSVKIIPPNQTAKLIGYDMTSIFIDGPFDLDSPQKVQVAINKVNSGNILFHLNSPGGNLMAGMQIGRLIRKAGGQTYILKYKIPTNDSVDNTDPGECYSACSLAFLGGIHRYIDNKALYGVHRFSMDKTSATDLDVAQILSAAITNYIVEMGVSSELFTKMVEAGKGEIRILDQRELKELKVANGGSGEPEWSIEAIEGGIYLRGMQDNVRGFGKLVFMCSPKGVVLQSVYEAGNHAKEISAMANFNTLRVDDKNYPLPKGERFLNEGYINNLNLIPKELVEKMIKGKSLGYSMQVAEGAPIFWGFTVDIGSERNRRLIKNYLNNCVRNIN